MAKETMGLPEKAPFWSEINLVVAAVVGLFVIIACALAMFETNDLSHFHVKQAAMSGKGTVINEPGVYVQGFGKVTEYQRTGLVNFSHDDKSAIMATFRGNSTAEISGIIKYEIPRDVEKQMQLHVRYGSDRAVTETLVKQALAEAIKQTSPLFSPEEAFIQKREQFTAICREMLVEGIFHTYTDEVETKMDGGEKRVETVTKIVVDKLGKPTISKPSTLKDYNIQIIDFVIREFEFDELTDKLIAAKKQAEQEKVVARANAEKAKQDAITAFEQGKAKVATAEAEENVKKIRAVVEAKQKFEVAEYQKKQAGEEAKAKILQGEAEAQVARQKVAAGLTPLERAQIEASTRVGVAAELAKTKFPDTLIIAGGDGKGGEVNPWTAVGLNSAYDLAQKMAVGKK